MISDTGASIFIIVSGVLGALFAAWRCYDVLRVSIDPDTKLAETSKLIQEEGRALRPDVLLKVNTISKAIAEGATSFLFAEYRYMAVFMFFFSIVIFVVLGVTPVECAAQGVEDCWKPSPWAVSGFSTIAFNIGCVTSILSGYIGMRIAVAANSRTALQSMKSLAQGFDCAFRAGLVMGFGLTAMAVLNLFISILLFRLYFGSEAEHAPFLFDAISSYGLGGSSIALFGRVGGGIYTKAADVGADLVGKVEQGIPEDDPRNPAVIADNVGDNVGDVAGMGADLFGSFAESSCAALVLVAQAPTLQGSWPALMFPLAISAAGIIICFFTSFIATNVLLVKDIPDIEPSLKRQLLISTVLMTPVIYLLCVLFLPKEFQLLHDIEATLYTVKNWHVFFCVASGLWSGLIIGYITEYYTSHSYGPVRELSDSCKTGAATNVIYGLALGYKSVIVPVFCLCITIYVGFRLAGTFGIAVAALGILSTLSIGLTIDCYGPISDNAGGIAEMAGMGHEIRKRTDALDAAGNTTAAIGKGFAIASAALVSLALFGAFIRRAFPPTASTVGGVTVYTNGIPTILNPFAFAGLLYGSMLPYWFSAMTMKSVGNAALEMVEEVRDQFKNIPGLMDGSGTPDYDRCVRISTVASLKEMLPPGALVMLTPLIVGFLFSKNMLAGVLIGGLVSGVQMAISSSNTGGAWDNAKKYIEAGYLGGKGTEAHTAAVIGDTVGDPLKDTSGPALNILMKLMAIISLVFSASIKSHGSLLEKHIS